MQNSGVIQIINMKKKWMTKCKGRMVRHGAKGMRTYPGTKRGDSFCARSLGIAKEFPSARLPCSPNYLSRRRWKCKLEDIEK
jgi:hypothetical protein